MNVSLKYEISRFDVMPDYFDKAAILIKREKYSQSKITLPDIYIGKDVLCVLLEKIKPEDTQLGCMRIGSEFTPFYDTIVSSVKQLKAGKSSCLGVVYTSGSWGDKRVRTFILSNKSGCNEPDNTDSERNAENVKDNV